MNSQRSGEFENQDMEKSVSSAQDKTAKPSSGDVDGRTNRLSDHDTTSASGGKPGLYHLDKKAKLTHTPDSPFKASLDNTNNADSNTVTNTINSNNSEATNNMQSSQSHLGPDLPSAEVGFLGPPDDEASSSFEPENFYPKFRKPGGLMTLHIFTGRINGTRPCYVPVYKRNDRGQLLKLTQTRSGRWGYMVLKELAEDETEGGLKIFEEPEAELVPQGSERAGRRRTLVDLLR